jgi:hypothetical protein
LDLPADARGQLFDHSAAPSDAEGEAANHGGEGAQKKARVEVEEAVPPPPPAAPVSLQATYLEQSALMRQVVKDAAKETQRVLGEQLLTWADRQLQGLTREAKRFEPPGELAKG